MTDLLLDKLDLLEVLDSLEFEMSDGVIETEEVYDISDEDMSPHALAGDIEGALAMAELIDEDDVEITVDGGKVTVVTVMEADTDPDSKATQLFNLTNSMIMMVSSHDREMSIEMANTLVMNTAREAIEQESKEGEE